MTTPNAPNFTLYVNNLNEQIKIPALKDSLREVFSPHGNILDIVAGDSLRRRGQAFIVFDSVESATAALQALQGHEFFTKPLRIQYARSKSDAIASLDGTLESQIQKRKRTREMQRSIEEEERARREQKKLEMRRKQRLPPNNVLFVENIPEIVKMNVTNTLALKNVFLKIDGCIDVRYIPQKNVAFVEYENIEQAAIALADTNRYLLFDTPLEVSYARAE